MRDACVAVGMGRRTDGEVARSIGVPRRTVADHRERLGIPPARRDVAAIVRRVLDDGDEHHVEDVAARAGCCARTVRDIVARMVEAGTARRTRPAWVMLAATPSAP